MEINVFPKLYMHDGFTCFNFSLQLLHIYNPCFETFEAIYYLLDLDLHLMRYIKP